MTYADVLTNAALLDPHAWSDAQVWTVALDATEARRRSRSSGRGGFSIGGLLLCIGVVVVVIGLVIWLRKRGSSNQSQQQYPQQPYQQQFPQAQQYPQPYPPQQDFSGQPQYPAPPQYQQPYQQQPQQQYQQYPQQQPYPPQQPYQPPHQ
ncbi:hypothetical protein ACW9HR_20545 [Nocardia gipuzkoensis]